MNFKITLTGPGGESRVFNFKNRSVITFGRDPSSDIQIDESELGVSRKQCEIYFKEGAFIIKNLGRNPIAINGRETAEKELSRGDEIVMGSTKAVFEMPDAEGAAAAIDSEETVMLKDVAADSEATVIFEQPASSVRPDAAAAPAPSGESRAGAGRAPDLLANPVYVKLYENAQFIKAYPLFLTDELKVGRSKGNDIMLDNREISRNLLTIRYGSDGIMVSYTGRTAVTFGGRLLPPGNSMTEEISLGGEVGFVSYKLVFSDNDQGDAPAILYLKQDAKKPEASVAGLGPGGEQISEDADISELIQDKKKKFDLWKNTKIRIAAAAAILFIAGFAGIYGYLNKGSRGSSKEGYAVEQVTRVDFQDTMDIPGIINFLNPVPVVNELSGKVLEVGFKDGDLVQSGQLLFRIDDNAVFQQLQQAKAELINAQSNFKKLESWETSTEYNEISKSLVESQTNLNKVAQRKEKIYRLVNKGILPKNEIERIDSDYDNARMQNDNLKARLELARNNYTPAQNVARFAYDKARRAEEEVQKLYGKREVRAGLAGIISVPVGNTGKLIFVKGQSMNADTIVAYIGDFDNIGLKVEVAESEIRKLQIGQRVKITTETIKDRDITGSVSEIASSATIKESSSSFEVKIKIDTDDDLRNRIKVGMSASASIILSENFGSLAVPVPAVFNYEGKSAVLYFDKSKNIKMAFVSTGKSNQSHIELMDSNVPEGTSVVASNAEETLKKLDAKKLAAEAARISAPQGVNAPANTVPPPAPQPAPQPAK